jgi:SAM-dependent methyltransferase
MQIKRYTGIRRSNPDFSYNGYAGKWWQKRAGDAAHQRAYRNIADFIRDSLPRTPRLILDYACGAGNLIALLGQRFPNSQIIGLDGSSLLLDLAEKRLSRLPYGSTGRISLIETPLPGRTVFGKAADLVVYCFPNMMPSGKEEERRDSGCLLSKRDQRIAESLVQSDEFCNDDEDRSDADAVRRDLEYGRSISHHLRRLLALNGICVRVEYATTRRHEWSPHELLQVSFEEGSLDVAVNGLKPRPWFRVLASAYFRSRVLEDVFEQTGDDRDKNGGYLITVLRAIP